MTIDEIRALSSQYATGAFDYPRLPAVSRVTQQPPQQLAPPAPPPKRTRVVRKGGNSPQNLKRGNDWNRRHDVTVAAILELQAQGMTAAAIAERLGCKRPTIYKRLRDLRLSSPEASHADDALRTCGCGRRKWAASATCSRCAGPGNKRESMARRGK